MINTYWNEEWREIKFPPDALRKKYAISNYGRVISYKTYQNEGVLVKGGCIKGYKTLPLRPMGNSTTYYIHKLVALYFLTAPTKDDAFVIHLDFNKSNNFVQNLKWATSEETYAHQQTNPSVLKGREKIKRRCTTEGHKLNATQVMRLKKKLLDPHRKTKLRIIAKQFGVSEMQLHRIRKGENWAHVEVQIKDESQP